MYLYFKFHLEVEEVTYTTREGFEIPFLVVYGLPTSKWNLRYSKFTKAVYRVNQFNLCKIINALKKEILKLINRLSLNVKNFVI